MGPLTYKIAFAPRSLHQSLTKAVASSVHSQPLIAISVHRVRETSLRGRQRCAICLRWSDAGGAEK